MPRVFLFARGVVHGDQMRPLHGEKNDASSLYPAEFKNEALLSSSSFPVHHLYERLTD